MSQRHFLLSILCGLLTSAAHAEDWVTYEPKPGPGQGKHIVLLSGDEEYRSEEALPLLGKILSQRHGFKCTVLFAVDPDGTINPDNSSSLPGAKALDSADAIVMALRFRAYPDEIMKHFVDAYRRGVPIIALRTSTHAFRFPRESKSAYGDFSNFGKRVLGEGWVNHWGRHKVEATRGIIDESAKYERILRGISEVFGDSDVYEAYPPADAKILIRGQVLKGMKPGDDPAEYRRRRSSDKQEQPINDPMMPVAWTRIWANEAGNSNRIFCTTMGAATDLQDEGLRRLVVNAVYWGIGRDVPEKADVAYVDEYKPTMYGFKGYRKGVKPADYALRNPEPPVKPQPEESGAQAKASDEPPSDWVDPATGHRVLRLSREPGTASLYFHQHPYTAKGDKLFVTTSNGLATIDLTTLGVAPPKIEKIGEGRAGGPIVGRKTRRAFYVRDSALYGTHLDTQETKKIADLPPGLGAASGLAINADETLIASTGTDPQARALAKPRPGGSPAGNRSMCLFTVRIETGEIKKHHYATDWLNHTQFSPTDPSLILFCHEGTWQDVDRIWTIRLDGKGPRLMHPRTMPMEIAGHEFFSHDGKMVWYDLQTPRSKEFWLAGVNIESGERIRYPIERQHWSVHYNQSNDGKFFAGDGGGPNSVANRGPDFKPWPTQGNGQWVYLFTPRSDYKTIEVGGESVKVGQLDVERLVDLSKHNYRLEPNLTFTPDNRWIVFRSNMHGPTHVYAVEGKKLDNKEGISWPSSIAL